MKTIQSLLIITTAITIDAFTPYPSSFTGSASAVCSRAELTTEYRCPKSSSAYSQYRGRNLGMPPFLKKLGLKKPENPIFGGGDKEESTNSETALLTREEETAQQQASATITTDSIAESEEKELSQTEQLLKKIKEAGTAGVISYALWELGFWALSVPVCVFGYYQLVGHWPDFSNPEDTAKLGGEAFAFVNFARFAVPLRIGLALSTTPWIQENVVDKFGNKEDEE